MYLFFVLFSFPIYSTWALIWSLIRSNILTAFYIKFFFFIFTLLQDLIFVNVQKNHHLYCLFFCPFLSLSYYFMFLLFLMWICEAIKLLAISFIRFYLWVLEIKRYFLHIIIKYTHLRIFRLCLAIVNYGILLILRFFMSFIFFTSFKLLNDLVDFLCLLFLTYIFLRYLFFHD